ncbi:MAG: glycosyltransferase, partial [Patulibacter sp.]
MPTPPTIDVVVVTWRQRELTLRCLEHLGAQTAAFQLIVVDNASGDGTADAVRARWPDATVIEQAENVGFGRACNAGAAAGTGEVIVLVNNDLFVEPQFLAKLVAPLAADEQVGQVAGVTLLPGDGPARIDSAGVLLDRTLAGMNFLRHAPAAAAAGRRPGV